jgi:hypothetical protein
LLAALISHEGSLLRAWAKGKKKTKIKKQALLPRLAHRTQPPAGASSADAYSPRIVSRASPHLLGLEMGFQVGGLLYEIYTCTTSGRGVILHFSFSFVFLGEGGFGSRDVRAPTPGLVVISKPGNARFLGFFNLDFIVDISKNKKVLFGS